MTRHASASTPVTGRGPRPPWVAALSKLAVIGFLTTMVAANPVGAQGGPSATASAVCYDGAHGIEMSPSDPSELHLFDFYLDGELILAELGDNDSTLVDGLENGVYSVLVNVYLPGDTPTELLSTDVTLACPAEDLGAPPPTTTTTTPPPSTTGSPDAAAAPDTLIAAPPGAPRRSSAGATLAFTG